MEGSCQELNTSKKRQLSGAKFEERQRPEAEYTGRYRELSKAQYSREKLAVRF
jgi:hypothetical protein